MFFAKRQKKEHLLENLLLFIVFVVGLPASALTQNHSLGLEFQAYPTGLIPTLSYKRALANEHWSWGLRLGGNFFDHRDFGVQQMEKGKGLGFSPEYSFYLQSFSQKSLFFSLRSDFWRNWVRWENVLPNDGRMSGLTRLLVVQPTLQAGYQWVGTHWRFALTTAFGFEINALTQGEPTGQGPIFLLGFVGAWARK